MDADKGKQKNLTLWCLVDRCAKFEATLAAEVRNALVALDTEVSVIGRIDISGSLISTFP